MCGDRASDPTPRRNEAGGALAGAAPPPAATYTEGQVIQTTTVVSTYHAGRLGFRVCRFAVGGGGPGAPSVAAAEAAALTEGCLDAAVLVQADVPGAQAPGDPWFHLGAMHPEGWRGNVSTALALPPGLTCDGVGARCVLQWYYMTGNSCNPPGEAAQYLSNNGMGTCGTVSNPEEASEAAEANRD